MSQDSVLKRVVFLKNNNGVATGAISLEEFRRRKYSSSTGAGMTFSIGSRPSSKKSGCSSCQKKRRRY